MKQLHITGFVFIFMLTLTAYAQEGPSLPAGLEDKDDGPSLPSGLGSDEGPSLPSGMGSDPAPSLPGGLKDDSAPSLPAGLGSGEDKSAPAESAHPVWYSVTGFLESRGCLRTQSDPYEKDASAGEIRFQWEFETRHNEMTFRIRPDFLYDPVMDDHDIDLEEGRGFIDLREASVSLSPLDFADVKIGRQILTWGTGDMLFINDMFPKDWQSFFIGRDDEYLKAPSDAVKVSLFSDIVNFDLVYTPKFDADRSPCGKRLSYYNQSLGRRAGDDAVVRTDKPDRWFRDDELAARIYRNFHGIEFAAYAYMGYWKGPAGMNPDTGKALFPELNVYGASVRGQIASGIANLELGCYDSHEDKDGTDMFIDNSQFRILLGYERDLPEITRDFKAGMQYYVEHIKDYEQYEENLPPGAKPADENRHVITFRLTKQMMNQNLMLSLFTYYSPTDADVYLRPNVQYKIDDNWTAIAGGNTFTGKDDHTFFAQFEKNSNVYAGLRYGF
ncbi:hypothetical protein QUF80_12885 [Desulfococcaceae bacterium HSG8]|nr:hypothetical protein [Desulfococcaceae bacterium HSG8]